MEKENDKGVDQKGRRELKVSDRIIVIDYHVCGQT